MVVVWDVATFQCYLFGSPFTLVTNHKPLKWLMEFDRLMKKLARWAFIFQEYDFDVKHLVKIINKDVDGLNKNSIANELDTTITRWHGEINLETMHNWHVVSFFCILVNGCHEVSC